MLIYKLNDIVQAIQSLYLFLGVHTKALRGVRMATICFQIVKLKRKWEPERPAAMLWHTENWWTHVRQSQHLSFYSPVDLLWVFLFIKEKAKGEAIKIFLFIQVPKHTYFVSSPSHTHTKVQWQRKNNFQWVFLLLIRSYILRTRDNQKIQVSPQCNTRECQWKIFVTIQYTWF